jgi:uncharacterized Zn finger protein (UPF0148 family)
MPEPEIARRCPTCGVSIREAALFCPQCGNGLPQTKTGQSQTDVAAAAERTTSKNTTPLNDSERDHEDDSSDKAEKNAGPAAPSDLRSDTVAIPKTDKAAKTSATASARAAVAPRVRGAVGAKIQRATTLARDVEGDVKDRARKVRQISSVVLDEAGYDPSLRFVLVAVALFVLFLIIVLLNKFIT